MLNREELREMAKIKAGDVFFVSLYLNVNPATNTKNDYVIHVKNMLKQTAEKVDKAALKRIREDLEKIDSYIRANKRIFRKGLAIVSSQEMNFWKEFHLSIPVKNEIIVDDTPYVKPLLDILDNYQRYALVLVGSDSARLFIIHLGEIEEYSEVHSEDVPGRHKKGGWYALSEKSYERHRDYHVGLHLKDVLKQLDSFLSREYVGRVLISGSEEAVAKVRTMLSPSVTDKVIGTFQADMSANTKEILEKAEPIVRLFERKEEEKTIDDLLTRAMKNENAVIGIDDVLNALQEGRLRKLIFLKDYNKSGLTCKNCGFMTTQDILNCPYCKGKTRQVNYIVDLIAQRRLSREHW